MQKRGNHDFSFKTFCHTVPKNFVGEHFGVSENFGYRKILCIREGGVITFLSRKLFVTQYQKFRWGTFRCIGKFRVSKKFLHQRGRGYHISQSKTFCHTVPRNFVGEHFGVSESFGYRKILCIREGGAIPFLSRKLFVTQYQKMSLGNSSTNRELLGIEKLHASEREGVSHFSIENFLSHSTKISLGLTSVYREISGVEKISASEREGLSHFSVEKVLSHSTRKCRWGTLRCIRKFRISKQFMHQRERERERERDREAGNIGKYHVSPSKTFCLTVPIKFVGEHFCVSKDLWYRIFEANWGGSFTVLSKFFLSNRTEKTSPGNQSDSGKLW